MHNGSNSSDSFSEQLRVVVNENWAGLRGYAELGLLEYLLVGISSLPGITKTSIDCAHYFLKYILKDYVVLTIIQNGTLIVLNSI